MASITIAENTPPDTLVATISAPIHPDDGWASVLGGIDGTDSSVYFDFRLQEDGSFSVYSTATAFDFENPPTVVDLSFQVLVYADGGTYDIPITLTVTDDTAPTGLALTGNTVAEDAAPGTVVGTLSATDAEGQTLTYTLTDDAAGRFEIVGNELRVKAGLDREIAAEHAVTVQVSDGENQVSQTFTIGVTDVAELLGTITIDASGADGMDLEAFLRGGFVAGETGGGFPSFDNSGNFSGEEMFIGYGTDAASKYVLAHGQLAYGFGTHTIHGMIDTLEYGTRGTGSFDADGYFVGGAAQLRITGLDFTNALPANAAEEAEIEASGLVHLFGIAHMYGDATGTPNEQRVLAALAKIADALDLYAQNFIGSSGADLYVGTQFGDTIRGQAGNDILSGGGGVDTAIFGGNFADYTITRNADGTITIADNVTGDGDDGTDRLLGIEKLQFADGVQDAPENEAPTNFAFSTSPQPEDTPVDTVVGTFSATDPEGGALTYALVTDAGGLFELVGNELRLKSELDYETNASPEVTVKVTDLAGNEVSQTFTVTVTDLDEAPVNLELSSTSVLESAAIGTVVGTFSATDPEGGAITYVLTADAGDKFEIVGNELRLKAGVNFEAATSHAVTVTATDANDNVTTRSFTINVGNVDEAPTAPTLSATAVAENSAVGTVVGTLASTDPEGGAVSYVLTNDADGLFVVDGNQIKLAKPLGDYETAASKTYDITVEAKDAAGNTTARTFTIRHADAFDAPEGTLTIDASGLGSTGVNFSSFITNYFAGLAGPSYNFYGGTPDANPYGPGNVYVNGDQIAFRYKRGGVDTADRVVLGGEGLAYDYIHHGAQYGHGISGSLDTLTFGQWVDGVTTGTEGTGSAGLLQGLLEQVRISGFDLDAVRGTGSNASLNLVHALYNAVQSRNAAAIYDVLSNYAQNFTGTTGNDVFFGSGFGDTIDGNGGMDVLVGGDGNDVYIVDGSTDVVVENFGEGIDTIRSTASYRLSAHVENLQLLGSADLDGTGNELANTIIGNSGNNKLDGGAGADSLSGAAGDDIYVVDNAGDRVTEAAGAGTDSVEASVSFALSANVENLTLTGSANINGTGNTLNNVIAGNGANNVLNGGGGADRLVGGAGNDTYVTDGGDTIVETANAGTDMVQSSVNYILGSNLENLTLTGSAVWGTGNTLHNVITGNGANNVLNGGGGADRLVGGAGNDTYVADGGDTIVEVAGAGTDTVRSSVNYILGSNLENLTLTGSAVWGTGNTLNNVITGNGANNVLNGGGGADRLVGGDGNDNYITDGGDVIVEAAGAGTDTVQSSANHTLAANLENLTLAGAALVGTGNTLNNVITGNALANTLNGGGVDRLVGGAGNDTYVTDGGDTIVEAANAGTDTVRSSVNYTLGANLENLTLTGSAVWGTGNTLNNVIAGNALANTLNGGAGADRLVGGTGNDTYYVDNAGDVVVEAAGQGTDRVFSSVNHSLAANVENLTLTGSALVGVGNGLGNVITGNALANTLNGGAGADRLVGGAGNDTYHVDNARDVVVEVAGQGTDRVISSVSHTLAAHVENLTLSGSAVSGTGNTLNNVIVGTTGNNVLAGGWGNDTLTGGAGSDTFLFNTSLNRTSNVDRITDFNVAADTIRLDNAAFKGLAAGWLAAGAFHTGAAAADAQDRIIYNKATGAISFDADGSGSGAAIHFATVSAGLALTNADFFVI
ncbi:cadherin domain-containing protein [Mesorhizobium sp. L-8-3]|uniref:cadherin domain-containing protein n=1 Tax=Mesorhizobium sp. L-8-3 TaxID=2744522 RepID=UPI001927CA91|nr:cadherin domain-containing protein [Mesorhizobium sp. L-8-3]BCH20393.1 hypothetical protein MesoLjLb_01780 [Mesorhizobium sp. L-8-3]